MTLLPRPPALDGFEPIVLPGSIAFLLRHGIGPELLCEAARLAVVWGVSADEALIRSGLASEAAVYRALAAETGRRFDDRELRVHRLARFPASLTSALAPLERTGDDMPFAFAPRGQAFADFVARHGEGRSGLVVTTPTALREAVFAARGQAIAQLAAEGLARASPQDSYRDGMTLGQMIWSYLILVLGILSIAFSGLTLWVAITTLVSFPFLALVTIKLAAIAETVPMALPRHRPRIPDRDLPVYTVLVPLHREEAVLPQLLEGLRRLDYPAAKLDVKLIVEEGDRVTAGALARLSLPPFVEVITAPAGEPRTKPRALNVALPLARGAFLVIYDAEDVPDPQQLRDAVWLFGRSEPDVACLQARLVIDNTADSWLTRFFTVEYATLFDVVNPAIARFYLPMPLGGTSNHLKTAVLRAVGGWDAWNVTEDADLAMRLATAGYHVADLPSSTLEEAPSTLPAWLAQRTRWLKGFLQVAVTHSRRPIRNFGRLGLARLLGAMAATLGVVASALAYPVFAAILLLDLVNGSLLSASTWPDHIVAGIALVLAAGGLAAMILPPLVAIRRRGWLGLWPYALLMPFYCLLMSVAAWSCLWELIRDPHRWNKTAHGLARSSRAGLVTAGGTAPPPRRPARARR